MGEHFDLVASRFRNMLARITARDPDFDDLCRKHAALTTQIRTLHSNTDPVDSERDQSADQQHDCDVEGSFGLA